VPADVEQGANFAVRCANDDDGFSAEVYDQVIAGAGDAADVAGTEPVPEQHTLHVALEYAFLCFEAHDDAPARYREAVESFLAALPEHAG